MPAESRSVVVRLSADTAAYIAQITAAGKATDAAFAGVDGKVAGTSERMRELDGSTREVGTSMDDTGSKAKRLEKDLDSVSGRLGLLAEAAIVLGPALAPIGAVGVAGVLGLTSALGFAVGGAGTAVLAFQGVGDALKAVNTAQLEPTAANLAKAREQMNLLGPDAQHLVTQLADLRDVGAGLRNTAAAGVLPGVSSFLDDALTRLPTATKLLATFGDATGDVVARAGSSLASGRFDGFFDFLDANARANIDGISTSVGNLAHAGAELFQAFEPLERDFLDGLVRGTEGLDKAASGLDGSDGLTRFIGYVRDEGPQVLDTLGAVGGLLVDVVTAAAPIGGPVLGAIEALADGFSVIAESDLGTPILAGAAALTVYQRALTTTQRAQSAVFGGPGAAGGSSGVAGGTLLGGSGGRLGLGLTELRSSLPTLQQAGTYVYRLGQSADVASVKTTEARKAVSGFATAAAPLGRAAAGGAALAVASTGIADGFGAANTASLALAGAMVGGAPGAVAGGLVGAFLDVRATGDTASDAVRDLDRVFGSSASTIGDYVSQLTAARATLASTNADLGTVSGVGDFFTDSFAGLNLLTSGLDGSDFLADLGGDTKAKQKDLDDLARALYGVNDALGGAPVKAGVSASGNGNTLVNLDSMTQIAQRAKPALDDLGISLQQLGSDPDAVGDVVARLRELDSSDGRIDALSSAVSGLDNQLLSTAESAGIFADSLDAALNPGLSLSAATDQLQQGLRNLDGDLDKTNKSLRGQSAAAAQNRDAIREQVTNIGDQLKAQAASGASSDKLAGSLRRQKQALLDAGAAAGLSKSELRTYLNTLGLTPKLVSTFFKADTAQANANISALGRNLANLKSKTIYINTIERRSGPGGQSPAGGNPSGLAAGGALTSPGGPATQVPAALTQENP